VAIRKDAARIRGLLEPKVESWITADATNLPDGDHPIRLTGPWGKSRKGKSRTNLELNFKAGKSSTGIPELVLVRFDDTDFSFLGTINDIIRSFPQNVKEAVDSKSPKLRQYKGHLTTVLLLEIDDNSPMDKDILANAIVDQYSGLPTDIDQVWFADTSLVWDVEFHDLGPLIQYRVNQSS